MACVCGRNYHKGYCNDPVTLSSIHKELLEIKELIKSHGLHPCTKCSGTGKKKVYANNPWLPSDAVHIIDCPICFGRGRK